MSSNEVIDEFVVKIGVDSSEYDQKVEKLTESNEKLGEGLEDTEKRFDKTSKATRENAKDIKNVTGEFQKLGTNINTVLSSLAKFGVGIAAGTGLTAFVGDIAKANIELANTSTLTGIPIKNLQKWEYAFQAVGARADLASKSLKTLKQGMEMPEINGETGVHLLLNRMDVAYRDGKGELLPAEQVMSSLHQAVYREVKAGNQTAVSKILEEGGLGDLFDTFANTTPQQLQSAFNKQENKYLVDDESIKNFREFNNNMGEIENHFKSLSNLFADSLTPELTKLQNVVLGFLEHLQENPDQAKALGVATAVGGTAVAGWGLGKIFTSLFGSGGGAIRTGASASGSLLRHVPAVGATYALYEGAKDDVSDIVARNGGFNNDSAKEITSKGYEQTIKPILGTAFQPFEELYKSVRNALGFEPDKLEENEGIHQYQYSEVPIIGKPQEHQNKAIYSSAANGLSVGGVGSVVDRELKDGNILLKEANQILKKIETSPTIKNIEEILKEAFVGHEDDVKIDGYGTIRQVRDSGMPAYRGSNTIRESYDGTGVSPHTGKTGEGLMDYFNRQNNSLGDKENIALNYFKSKGWSDEQSAGIVANLKAESGLQHTALNPNESDEKGNQFSSKGIAQWNRERLDKFKEVIGTSIEQSTFEQQLKFVQWELENTHRVAAKKLRSASNTDEATEAITRHYEIPANMDAEIRKRQAIASGLASSNQVEIPYGSISAGMSRISSSQQAIANHHSSVEVSIGDIVIQTTATTMAGVGADFAEAVQKRLDLGQLTSGRIA